MKSQDPSILESGVLESMDADEAMGSWYFQLRFERPLPLVKYRFFTDRMKQLKAKVPALKAVDYLVSFSQTREEDLAEYYDFPWMK
ncbi:MAG: hypothetical protein MZU97_17940 [Bacillus subtilis]|nr:hypothetical protein [Bacillus subtilis]